VIFFVDKQLLVVYILNFLERERLLKRISCRRCNTGTKVLAEPFFIFTVRQEPLIRSRQASGSGIKTIAEKMAKSS